MICLAPVAVDMAINKCGELRTITYLRESHIQILNRFVDLGCALVANGHAIDAGIPEREPHRCPPVVAVECAFADELHCNYAHSFFADFLHMLDNFGDIP